MKGSKYFLKCLQDPQKNGEDWKKEKNKKYSEIQELITTFLSHSLNFPLSQPELICLRNQLTKIEVEKFDYLNIWDSLVKNQLTSFINRIENVLKVYEYPSKDRNEKKDEETLKKIKKLIVSALNKLDACSEDENYRKNSWCRCLRKTCPSRFDSSYLKRKLKSQFSNTKQIKWAVVELIKARLLELDIDPVSIAGTKFEYIGVEDDLDCDVLTLENSKQKNKKMHEDSEKVVKSLLNMKIIETERLRCEIDASWLLKMKAKVQSDI